MFEWVAMTSPLAGFLLVLLLKELILLLKD
jgi:hypothetical protein